MENLHIPNKSLFKIEEVCSITGVKPYVLRFWESEFDQIEPVIGSNGRKMYEHKDILAIGRVKHLLFDQKLTVQKAKKLLSESVIGEENFSSPMEYDEDEVAQSQLIINDQNEMSAHDIIGSSDESCFEEESLKDSDTFHNQLTLAKTQLKNVVQEISQLKSKYNW